MLSMRWFKPNAATEPMINIKKLETTAVIFLAFFVSSNAERRDSIPDSNAVSDVTQICLR